MEGEIGPIEMGPIEVGPIESGPVEPGNPDLAEVHFEEWQASDAEEMAEAKEALNEAYDKVSHTPPKVETKYRSERIGKSEKEVESSQDKKGASNNESENLEPDLEPKNYYDVLGVSEEASQDEIKSAYRKLIAKLHPDRNPGDKEVAAKFQKVQEAYETLSDEAKRAEYGRSAIEEPPNNEFDRGPGYSRSKESILGRDLERGLHEADKEY